VDKFLADLGALAPAYAAVDWDASPVGPPAGWSPALVGAVGLISHTSFPITLLWGDEFTMLYNEAYTVLIADKHPGALGSPARDVFPEAWHLIGPGMQSVLDGEGATYVEDEFVPLFRRGFLEECYFTFGFSPVRSREGRIEGVLAIATETTTQVIAGRRLLLLRELNDALAEAQDDAAVVRLAIPVLFAATRDFAAVDLRMPGVPFDRDEALPAAPDGPLGVELVEPWLDSRVAWLPLSGSGSGGASYLVVGMSSSLAPDEEYLGFLRLVAATLRQALDRVRARTAERRTAQTQRAMTEAFQRSLLPQPGGTSTPQVAVRYQSALEIAQIGGDWYDFFELPDGSLTVVIGDVAGHDQQAAAAMAQARNLLRGVASTMHPATPDRVLTGFDAVLRTTGTDIVATAILAHVARLDDGGLTFTWSNAGHPPPVLLGADGTTRMLDPEPDLLLGLDGGAARAHHQVHLEAGSTVVLCTDGLIERRDVGVTEGLAWLEGLLAGRQDLGVEELSDYLLLNAGRGEDDVALLVLRA